MAGGTAILYQKNNWLGGFDRFSTRPTTVIQETLTVFLLLLSRYNHLNLRMNVTPDSFDINLDPNNRRALVEWCTSHRDEAGLKNIIFTHLGVVFENKTTDFL